MTYAKVCAPSIAACDEKRALRDGDDDDDDDVVGGDDAPCALAAAQDSGLWLDSSDDTAAANTADHPCLTKNSASHTESKK